MSNLNFKLPRVLIGMVAVAAFAFTANGAIGANANDPEVVVEIDSVRSDKGVLAFAVFAEGSDQSFPKVPANAVLTKLVDAKKGESEISLGHLKPGKYAISVLHDENQDGKMNFHFFGMPKEGFGFSRNPRIAFGAPDFKDCVVEITPESAKVSVKAKYF